MIALLSSINFALWFAQAVAFALGLMVVLALSFSAYYAYKTRSKIWRHGKYNILWDDPAVRPVDGQDVMNWVSFDTGGTFL